MSAVFSAIVLFQVLALSGALLALAADNRPAVRSTHPSMATQTAATASAAAAVVSTEEMTDVERILTTPVAGNPVAKPAAADAQEDRTVRAA